MYIIGIAGGSGSGKTTFANKVQTSVKHNVSMLHMDSYYLPMLPKELFTKSDRLNYDHPAAFDWPLLRKHILCLKDGESVSSPVYDFKTSSRTAESVSIHPTPVIILEGIFTLFDNEIRDLLDIMCFLHVDSDIRFARRLHRDVKERGRSLESVIDQYYETVRPMHLKYLEPQKQFADFIVGEETDIGASILAAKLNELLENSSNPSFNHGLQRNFASAPEETYSLHEQ
ncbi:MAG: uridine kinase [Bacteriovoracaceae bacterium]|nr:uridine kinase [Bacteriovoracaceae bacterium]